MSLESDFILVCVYFHLKMVAESTVFLPTSCNSSSGGDSGEGNKSKPIVSDISNSIGGVDNLFDSKIRLVGQITTITLTVQENQGINNLEHVSLYFDTKQPDLSQDFKTTHVKWEKNEPISINNPSDLLDSANIKNIPVDAVNSKIK